MKRFFVLALSICLFASCSSSKKATKPTTDNTATTTTPPPVATTTKTESDGFSFEKAIVINETTETKGIDAEYAWIKNHYSGYSINGQALKMNSSKPYDIINITTAEGKKLDLYFDISNFYGK
jgi:opacity protein-like surface antigen